MNLIKLSSRMSLFLYFEVKHPSSLLQGAASLSTLSKVAAHPKDPWDEQ